MPAGDSSNKYFENLGGDFDAFMSEYDVAQRRKLIFDRLLRNHCFEGENVLEVGCGTGRFSQQIVTKGARLTVLDISDRLTRNVAQANSCSGVAGDATRLPFGDASFDMVISSECIEHTPEPLQAVREMGRVCKKDGSICFTTPNALWYPVLWLSMKTGVRKFSGYENWIFPFQARTALKWSGMSSIRFDGCHLWPFQLRFTRKALTGLDTLGFVLFPFMINFGVLARKHEKRCCDVP